MFIFEQVQVSLRGVPTRAVHLLSVLLESVGFGRLQFGSAIFRVIPISLLGFLNRLKCIYSLINWTDLLGHIKAFDCVDEIGDWT